MHTRPLHPTDLPYLSVLAAAAFADDELFGRTNPHTPTHPADFREYMLWRLRLRSTAPGMHAFVCVSDERDKDWLPTALDSKEAETPFGRLGQEAEAHDGEVLLGYAMWTRHGAESDACVRAWWRKNTDIWSRLNHKMWGWEGQYTAMFGLDQSVDQSFIDAFREYISGYHAFDPIEQDPGYWQLSILAVSPIARRKGVGKALMKWGMDRAVEEGVPAALNSSEMGMKLYQSLGFKTIGWANFDGAGSQLVWDPEGKWLRPAQGKEAEVEHLYLGKKRSIEAVLTT